MSIVSTLHLNTDNATSFNGNVTTFIVDWDTILHSKRSGKCKVYCKLRSERTTLNLNGTINASFQSNHSVNTNGVILANITKKYINSTNYYYEANTSPNQGVTVDIPTGKSFLNIIIG